MSKTKIPDKVVLKLWVRAGGRCEFPGCPKVLWRDSLTRKEINTAYLAHIIADSPDGPRGDPVKSPLLAKDFGNLMLLCDEHHRLIDSFWQEYTVTMLQEYKRRHEERIEALTAIDEQSKTHILFFMDNIGDRITPIPFNDALVAAQPKYPAGTPITIDLANSPFRDGKDDYFRSRQRELSLLVEQRVRQRVRTDGIVHLSIFALASIPLLVHFGHEVGDTIPSDVFQYHRSTRAWKWQEASEDDARYNVTRPSDEDIRRSDTVVLNLSFSGLIHPPEIAAAMTEPYCTYKMTIPNPDPNFLRTQRQLDEFTSQMRALLAEIRARQGHTCCIHVFAAVPAPVAVRLGQILLPKSDPPLRVYEHQKRNGGFRYALRVPEEE